MADDQAGDWMPATTTDGRLTEGGLADLAGIVGRQR
jgi:hypothetical protein